MDLRQHHAFGGLVLNQILRFGKDAAEIIERPFRPSLLRLRGHFLWVRGELFWLGRCFLRFRRFGDPFIEMLSRFFRYRFRENRFHSFRHRRGVFRLRYGYFLCGNVLILRF